MWKYYLCFCDLCFIVKHPAYNVDFHAEAEAKSVPGHERHAKLEARLGDSLKAKATYEANGALLTNYKILGNVCKLNLFWQTNAWFCKRTF